MCCIFVTQITNIMSRFKVGQTVYMDRGDKMKTLVVAKVIDNPLIPLYQYSFEAPNSGWACGEQSIRATINGKDLKISECYKESFDKDLDERINTIASAKRQAIGETESGLDLPEFSIFDSFRITFKPNLFLVKSIAKYAEGKNIIHIGSGQGHLVNMLKWQGKAKAFGIEPNINKEEWIKWRIVQDRGANIDINEVLQGEVKDYKYLLQHPDRTLLLINNPRNKDFLKETISLMKEGSELLYITLDELPFVMNDPYIGKEVQIKQLQLEGVSERNENIYSIIK